MVKCKVLSTESKAKDKQRHNVQMLAGSSPSERAKLGRAPIKWEPLAQALHIRLTAAVTSSGTFKDTAKDCHNTLWCPVRKCYLNSNR